MPVDDGDVEEDRESVDESDEERDGVRLSTDLVVDVALHFFRRDPTQIRCVLHHLHATVQYTPPTINIIRRHRHRCGTSDRSGGQVCKIFTSTFLRIKKVKVAHTQLPSVSSGGDPRS